MEHKYPKWLVNRAHQPKQYQQYYNNFRGPNGLISVERISMLLSASCLHSSDVGNIQFLLNTTGKTGEFTEQEFTIFLALVASYQRGIRIYDFKTLYKQTIPLVPTFHFPMQSTRDEVKRHQSSQAQSISILDDEFSSFQKATPNYYSLQHSEPSNKQFSFSPLHAGKGLGFGEDVGSRLANYNLNSSVNSNQNFVNTGSTNNNVPMIGEEDKYSALRQFALGESLPTSTAANFSEDSDFGDFQSFATDKSHHQSLQKEGQPMTTQNILEPIRNFPNNLPHIATDDDFGEFVSFDKGKEQSQQRHGEISSSIGFKPLINQKDSNQITSQATVKTPTNYAGLLGDSRFLNVSCKPGLTPAPAPLRTTLITGPSTPTPKDSSNESFEDFVSSNIDLKSFLKPLANTEEIKPSTICDTSPETISLASLDLGCYNVVPALENASTVSLDTDEKPKPPSIDDCGTQVNEVRLEETITKQSIDKYSVFKVEQQKEKHRCSKAWSKVMEACLKLMEAGANIFNSVSSSEVIREIMQTPQGKTYVLCLQEIYFVAFRVYHSWLRLGGDELLSGLHQKIMLTWDSIVPFLSGSSLHEDFEQRQRKYLSTQGNSSPTISEYSSSICHICMTSLINPEWTSNSETQELTLDFEGKLYHLPCANLWINEISPTLPRLDCV